MVSKLEHFEQVLRELLSADPCYGLFWLTELCLFTLGNSFIFQCDLISVSRLPQVAADHFCHLVPK